MDRLLKCVLAAGFIAGGVSAQRELPTYNPQTKFLSGQDVVPSFDGWLRNPDGTFTFLFGYFNRNWQEELVIPPGPNNKLEPGDVDQGQPTYFLPRRQKWVFRVKVPADWGQKELVWTLTSHGKTEKAYAQLTLEEEILERQIQTGGNLNPGEDDPNHPPSITIAPVPSASVGSPVTLTASVTDDGLPKPRPPRTPRPGSAPGQTNSAVTTRPQGLTVTWMEYRAPAKVTFDSTGPIRVTDGQAVTMAHFPEPGTYVLRAIANDSALTTRADVTITVK
jgi:hypothetical protein